MDFESYKQFRSQLLQQRCLLRLDCMNPVRALSAWNPTTPLPDLLAEAGLQETLRLWESTTGIQLNREQIVVGRGVRDLLAAVFTSTVNPKEELWLPNDVYPVYERLAADAGFHPRTFPTLPQPELDFLAESSQCATVVLPVPLSPLGRLPNRSESDSLLNWMHGSPSRLLIIDAVYTYDYAESRSFLSPFLGKTSNQTIALWSCSKSWLLPKSLGIAIVPPRLKSKLATNVACPAPSEISRVYSTIQTRPNLSKLQQKAFTQEWQRLATILRSASPSWQPPASGYFSVLDVPFNTLWNRHGILAVPASVFGAKRDDFSIVTCLHDLTQHRAAEL